MPFVDVRQFREIRDLSILLEGLWVQIGPILTRIFDFIDKKIVENHPHDGVISAFRARDGAAARIAIETDIMWAARNLEPTLGASASASGAGASPAA